MQSTDDSAGNSTANDSVPVEIDRVAKGRGRGNKGKGKQNKGNAKGKSKSAGKDKGKGKNTGYETGGKSGKGKSPNKGKKSGKGADKACYICGKTGHYARDCWSNQSVTRSLPVASGRVIWLQRQSKCNKNEARGTETPRDQ